MRKLLDYQLYDKSIYAPNIPYYHQKKLKYNLQESTPTLIGISLKHLIEPVSRFYNNQTLFTLYCRSCDNFFVAPYLHQTYTKEPITCPCCGHPHNYKHYRIRNKNAIYIPYNINIKLYEMKESIKLRLEYKAAYMNDPLQDFKEAQITEEIIFLPSNHNVIWQKQITRYNSYNQKEQTFTESHEIGYIKDYELMKDKTALSFIFFSDSDKNNQKISTLFNTLRKIINKRMKNLGYSEKKMYYSQGTTYKTLLNLLTIANRFRFWDGFSLNIKEEQTVQEWLISHHLSEDFDKQIERKMQNNKTYIQALTELHNIPNSKIIRKKLTLENLYIIKDIYKTIPDKIIAVNYIEPILNYKNQKESLDKKLGYYMPNPVSYKAFLEIYKIFSSYYKLTPTMIHAELNKHDEDILHIWKELDKQSKELFKEKIPSFRKLHDKLSVLLSKQKDREVIFDIPKEVFERLNLYLKNSKATVLEKYSQLKKVSLQLNNCAASYRNRINKNLQLVLVSDNQGKPQILLEINNGSIIQAKLVNNQPVKKNQILNDTVLEFAEKTKLNIKTIDISTNNTPKEIKFSA